MLTTALPPVSVRTSLKWEIGPRNVGYVCMYVYVCIPLSIIKRPTLRSVRCFGVSNSDLSSANSRCSGSCSRVMARRVIIGFKTRLACEYISKHFTESGSFNDWQGNIYSPGNLKKAYTFQECSSGLSAPNVCVFFMPK